MVEYPDIVLDAVLVGILYFGWKIIYWGLKLMYSKPNEINYKSNYTDDEPDGSNYVTMPDGERRLD